MTKEEAIEQFQNAIDLIKQNGKDWLDERDIPLLTMAIKALEQTDGDLISRDNAIELVNYALAENKDVLEVLENMPSAEKTANKININEYVKVKLTDYGKEIFYHQYDNLNKAFGKEIIKPSYPTVDSDGYTSFQLWYFMNLYGRYIDMGMQNVIEPLEIVFESADKTAEWIIVGNTTLHYECSQCGGAGDEWDKFCKHCGARMKEEEEE